MTCIGDLVSEFRAHPPLGSDPLILTLTERKGFVSQEERFNKRLATESLEKYKFIKRGDLAFNPYLLWAGALAYNDRFDSGVISPLYPTFRVRTGFDPDYVAHLLLSPQMIARYDTIAFGSVPRRRRSSVPDFLNLEVPTPPPLGEQRRIADILDHASAILIKRRQAIARFSNLTRSVFHAMFETSSQRVVPLGSLVTSGPQNGIYKHSSEYGNGTRILRIDSFGPGFLKDQSTFKRVELNDREIAKYRLSPGDLVISRVNSMKFLGRAVVIPDLIEATVFESNMMRMSLDTSSVDGAYLNEYMMSRAVRRHVARRAKHAVNQSSINRRDVISIPVSLPPLPEQEQFRSRASAIKQQEAEHVQSTKALRELRNALESRALRGEL